MDTPARPVDARRDADEARASRALQAFFGELAGGAFRFDLYYALRRIEATRADMPLLGRAARPVDEPVRVGQEPSLSFAPAAIATLEPARGAIPPRIVIHSFGLFGPNGPLPNHLTEYVRDRLRNAGDATLARFADILHQRLILLFYRAWAQAQSVVSLDRPHDDSFSRYVASLIGIGGAHERRRDAVPDHAKFANAGHLVRRTRNAEGLASILRGFFGAPVRIVEFCCHWLRLAPGQRTRLGIPGPGATLGVAAVAGNAVWDGQSRFRIEIGAMPLDAYEQFLPGGRRFRQLVGWVRNYVGVELAWDVRVVLARDAVPRPLLGEYGRLGWTTWIGKRPARSDADDLVLDAERWAARIGPRLGDLPGNS
ncbi:MAG: type VI secretion system baseplate subunit TssG [Rudaea sp.]